MRHIRDFSSFINEGLKGKLAFLEGKPISLVKTLTTVDKWNREEDRMDMKTTDEEVDGIIGEIGVGRLGVGDYEDHDTPGFWITDEQGKKKGFVMWDEGKGKFVEGESTFGYTYRGRTEEDDRILQLVKDNIH